MALYEKYLKEGSNSPIGMTYMLLTEQLEDFMKLLKMEKDDLDSKELDAGFNKVLKQYKGFKGILSSFVKRMEKEL